MNGHDKRNDVAIVGGGAIGCAIAHELAADHSVVLLERDQIASGSTGHATGNTSVVTGFHDNPEFAHYCNDFFREFDGTRDLEYTERPRVTLIPENIEERARQLASESAANGFETSYLTAAEVEETYPGVFDLDGFAGGIDYRDIGWVDPYTYTVALQKEAEASGADVRTGVTVKGIEIEGDRVTGVRTDAGTIEANTVVAAAGWRTRTLLEGRLDLPIYPFRWQAVDLDPGRRLREDYPMGLDIVDGLYWRGEHNGLLHVGGGEYRVQNPGNVRTKVKESYRKKVARLIPEKLSGVENARIVGEHTCETGDTATPDTDPIIDAPADAPDGLVVATGFHGCGIMASPAVGRGVRSLITGSACPFPLEPYRLDRFERRKPNFEFTPLLSAYGDLN